MGNARSPKCAANAGDGHLISQRRLPAGLHAPRHALVPHLRPRCTSNSRTIPPSSVKGFCRLRISATRGPEPQPPTQLPADAQTLPAQRIGPTHGFLPSVTLFSAAVMSAQRPYRVPPRRRASRQPHCQSWRLATATTGMMKTKMSKFNNAARTVLGGAATPVPARTALGRESSRPMRPQLACRRRKAGISELILLALVMHRGLPAVLGRDPARAPNAGIFGNRFRTRLWPQFLPRHRTPGQAARAAACGASAGSGAALAGHRQRLVVVRPRRPRPTAASRCSSDVRRFSGCSSCGRLATAGANLVLRLEPAVRRCAACAALRDGIRSGCGGMNAAGSRRLGLR